MKQQKLKCHKILKVWVFLTVAQNFSHRRIQTDVKKILVNAQSTDIQTKCVIGASTS